MIWIVLGVVGWLAGIGLKAMLMPVICPRGEFEETFGNHGARTASNRKGE